MRFLKIIASFYIALNIIGSSLMMSLVYVDFELRQDYIAKVLCINRDKPITVCGGQCYLSAQLKKAVEHQEKEADTSGRFFGFSLYNNHIVEIDFNTVHTYQDIKIESPYKMGNTRRYMQNIFKPPRSA